jgi:hypothetical protein
MSYIALLFCIMQYFNTAYNMLLIEEQKNSSHIVSCFFDTIANTLSEGCLNFDCN